MSAILSWLNTNIFTQTALFMGIIVAVGLIVQKKSGGEVLDGFISAMLGYFIFNTGTGAIGSSTVLINKLMKFTVGVTAGISPSSNALFTSMAYAVEYLAPRIIPCFIITWFVHILIVKFVKYFKVVYLTVHNMLSLLSCFYLFFYGVLGFQGLLLDVCAGAFMCIYITVSPMLVYEDCKRVTGGAFALGHFNQMSAFIASKIAPLCGDPEKENAENMDLPGWLKQLCDGGLSIALCLPLAYLFVWIVVTVVGNAEAIDLLKTTAGNVDTLVYMLLTSLQFAGATYILLYGLRMFLGALLPAFQGIAEKWIPDALPGIDTVAFYSLAPNAVIFGMISWMVGAVLTTIGCIVFKTDMIVIFMLAAAFSEMSAIGVIANSKGGWKACIVCGLVVGFLSTATAALFASGMGLLEQGVSQVNFDSNIYPAAVCYLFRMIFGKL